MINLENITKQYGDITAVDNVSLSIKEGEIFGLLGPNGAGKSTIINMISGLQTQDRGSLSLSGYQYLKNSVKIKRLIGLVPQDFSFYSGMTAKANIKFFGSLYGLKGKALVEAVDSALEFTGLTDSAKRRVKTFSGGMKRRLNIACGIVHSPKIIFFDEPTVGIDPQSRNHILRSIEKLNKNGCTIVYTTHYMEEAEELCSRIAIMDKGKIIALGTSKELQLLVKDSSRIIITTRNLSNLDKDSLLKIQGVKSLETDDFVLKITNDLGIHNINQLVKNLDSQGIVITDIKADVPSLETVFLNLTSRSLRD